jgi:flagellar biosynthetic protein FlhB
VADGSETERTEEATPKRREDARNKGEIPRSQELTTAVLLLGSAVVLQTTLPPLCRHLLDVFGYGLYSAGAGPLDARGSVKLIQKMGLETLGVLSVTLCSMAGIALAVAGLQARGILSTTPLAPNWGRVNPGAGLKRILGPSSLAELFKSLAKLLIVGLAVRSALAAAWPDIMALAQEGPTGLLEVVRRYALKMLTTAGIAYLALAVADYVYQIWKHQKSLRMSKEDVKQESKQSEGDPMVKQRMRSVGRALARRQMFKDVPTADVVVTNPTHIAVALKYDPLKAPAPYVLAIGQRKVAERIKKLALERGVPVIENKPLARALVAARAQPGTIIPAELYVAVAEVLAFVIRQRHARANSWRGSALA